MLMWNHVSNERIVEAEGNALQVLEKQQLSSCGEEFTLFTLDNGLEIQQLPTFCFDLQKYSIDRFKNHRPFNAENISFIKGSEM